MKFKREKIHQRGLTVAVCLTEAAITTEFPAILIRFNILRKILLIEFSNENEKVHLK